MRLVPFILLLTIGSCLVGCEVKPMPADKLFAFSNPKLKANIPGYGNWEIPTNFGGKLEMKQPDGTMLMIRVTSNAAKVIGAEGDRAADVEDQRLADEARALQQEQIRSAERSHAVDQLAGLANTAMPLLAARGAPASNDPSATGNPIRDIIRQELERMFTLRTGGPAGTPANGAGPVPDSPSTTP